MARGEFADRAILIAGGTSGVGLACARRFRDLGATKIALMGRNAERGAKAQAALGCGIFLQGDANAPAAACETVALAEEAFGGIDVLVTSTAGSALPTLFADVPIEDIPAILADQALGPMIMARAVLPSMRERRSGAIVSVASDAAKSATPGEAIIGAAMASIVMFSRALAMEAKRDGIRVNVATPSLIADTPITERLMADPFSSALFGKAAKMAHLGVATAAEVADLLVFLSSDAASKITGQAVSVNGGISAA
jgi:NAD(P)-dependent dehydrogenase (short-subunit alcohol dehydrogenase family)